MKPELIPREHGMPGVVEFDALDEEGNIVPVHDVFPEYDTKDERPYMSGPGGYWLADDYQPAVNFNAPPEELDFDELNDYELEELPTGQPQDHEVGAEAVRQHVETEPVVDLYPDQPDPDESIRLQFGEMTKEIFRTIQPMEAKRFFALSVWNAGKNNEFFFSSSLWQSAKDWLFYSDDRKTRARQYTRWSDKLQAILEKHESSGDGAPWLEIYKGQFNGARGVTKARINWDSKNSIAMKNAYYGGGQRAAQGAEHARKMEEGPIMSHADAVDRYQKQQEQMWDEIREQRQKEQEQRQAENS
ncbi:hypothetical protein FWF93_00500 [Candidatus Saccharibacteria bacterium]|nr:hypothetical protein [Candidatus Saccharibacteria bacterium]